MTLLDRSASETFRESHVPVIETERLVLRAPRFEDANMIATLVNDRRFAENTLRIPHPYGLADAQSFITGANASDGDSSPGVTPRCSAPAGLPSGLENSPRSVIGSPFRSGATATPPRPRAP